MARLRSLPRLLAAAFPSGRARWMWQPPSGQNVLLIFLLNNLLLHTVFLLIFYFLNYTCPTFSILYLSLYYSLPTLPTLQIPFFFLLIQRDLFPCSLQNANRQDCTWVLDEDNRNRLSGMCDCATGVSVTKAGL